MNNESKFIILRRQSRQYLSHRYVRRPKDQRYDSKLTHVVKYGGQKSKDL